MDDKPHAPQQSATERPQEKHREEDLKQEQSPLAIPPEPAQKKLSPKRLNKRYTRLTNFLARAGLALQKHYSEPLAYQFHTMRNGFIYFAVGLMTVLMANANMPPSLTQELVVLAGLILTAIGFIIAIKAYVRFVISRIVIFFSKK